MQQLKILLERDYLDDKTIGCLSYIKDGKLYQFATLEPMWDDNKKNKSCIPEGNYNAVKYPSKNFGLTYSVGVVGRSGILFHAGNTTDDTTGCILVGDYFDMHRQFGHYLMRSKASMTVFLDSIDDIQIFNLIVKRRVQKNGSQ